MPVGIPKRGYRVTKKLEGRTLEDIERELAFRVPDLVKRLEELTKPLSCPSCGQIVRTVDRDAIIYLIDRAMGKPKQRTEVDITQTYQFNADQLDALLERHLPAIAELIAERYHVEIPLLASQNERSTKSDNVIEGGLTNGSNKGTEEGLSAQVHEEEEV